MILFTPNNLKIYAIKTTPQRLSWAHGRAWDAQLKTIDGRKIPFHFESSYGRRMYFAWNNQWYVARMFQDNDPFEYHILTTSKH